MYMLTNSDIVSNKSLILIDELGAEIDYENSLKVTISLLSSSMRLFSTSPMQPS